ncbi:MAG: 16S rRNA (cytosine(1402)-N(4))-methyltransferase, partial [Kordiimonadaceae bacterium]|nr:16S rRNA (cytosine(1402)-N(4))-methyltransferase [Kordiimonadaceae bacterium]
PKKYGGRDFSALMQSTVVTKLATRCLSSAIMAMVPNSLGPAELLLVYGTEEQKQQYLPNLACGKDIPCFALTSTEGASDAGAMPDTGVVSAPTFKVIKRSGFKASDAEVKMNPRSRSARLRVAERTDAPVLEAA